MNRMKDYILKYHYLLIACLIVIGVYLYIGLTTNFNFVFLSDILDQQLKLYIDGWERIHSGNLPFWDWSNFLGANYFGSNTFYFIGSPFFWLSMLLPKVEWMPHWFWVLNLLKSLLCVYFTYRWIEYMTKSSEGGLVSSIAYVFSAYNLVNYSNNHMLDVVLFFPLALYFLEKYLNENKYIGLALSIGIIGITNYYFLYLFTPFLFLYALVRYLFIIDKFDFKLVLKKGLFFILLYIIGLLICFVTLIPSYMVLQNNPRSSELLFGFNTIGKINLFRFITSFFAPVGNWRENINYFVSTTVNEGISYGGGMVLYTLLLTPYLFIPFLTIKNKLKNSTLIIYIIYFIFALFPMFYILFNQNYETRWMINIVLINIMMLGIVVANRKKISKKIFLMSTIICSISVILFLLVTIKLNLCPEEWGMNILYRNVIISIVMFIIYFFVFNAKKYFNVLLCLTLMFEVGFSYYNIFKNDGWYLDFLNQKEFDQYNLTDSTVIDSIVENDDDFYRIDLGSLKFVSINDAYSFGYKSFNTYHSLYNYALTDYNDERFTTENKWVFWPQRGKWQLKNLLSSKYWLTYAGLDSSFTSKDYLKYDDHPPYGYELINKVAGIDIYQNKFFIELGYSMDNLISEKEFNEYDMLHQDYIMNNYVVVEDEVDRKNPEFTLNLVKDYDNNELITDVSGLNGYLYITFNNSFDLYTINNYVFKDKNGNVIKEGRTQHEASYFGVEIPEGAYTFECKMPVAYRIYNDDLLWYDAWYQNINQFNNVSVTENSVRASINLEKSSYVVSNIPFDFGWKVKANGKDVSIKKVNKGFIGFELPKGNYEIEMYYVPPGLKIGLIGTFAGLLSLIILYLIKRNRK